MDMYKGIIICEETEKAMVAAFLTGLGCLDVDTRKDGAIEVVTGLCTSEDLDDDLDRLKAAFPRIKVSKFVPWEGLSTN